MIENTVLLLISALFCWCARPIPGTEWSGEKAADFAAGIIIGIAAGGEIFSAVTGNDAAGTLLYGLAWYAAFPLIVLVRTVQAAQVAGAGENCYWDRVIWGRILLVLCVIFELARRSDVAEYIPTISALIGALSLLVWALKPHQLLAPKLIIAALWGAAVVGYLLHTNESISFESLKLTPDLAYLSIPLTILIYQASLHTRQREVGQ